ncbi:MAG: FAD-dependent oxidoreductase [Nitrospinales bacterium]
MKRELRKLEDTTFDLLIVGGGIYGAVVYWMAALFGLQTALIEKNDFGHATSGNSQKITYGGLRYLQNMDRFRVVQSLRELSLLMGLVAPHLVRPVRFLVSIYGHGLKGKETMAVGLSQYNLIAGCFHTLANNSIRIPKAGIVNTDETIKLYPEIDRRGLEGAAFWHEGFCQNPERLVLYWRRRCATLFCRALAGFVHHRHGMVSFRQRD